MGCICVSGLELVATSLCRRLTKRGLIAEEIKDASKTLPRAISWAVILNATLGFIMVLTLCFTLGDATQIIETPTGYPFIQVFYNTTQSYSATNVMVTVLIVTLTSSAISEVATASRQLWSFARDNGLPFSSTLSYVSFLSPTCLKRTPQADHSPLNR